jgi:hypothetical protein
MARPQKKPHEIISSLWHKARKNGKGTVTGFGDRETRQTVRYVQKFNLSLKEFNLYRERGGKILNSVPLYGSSGYVEGVATVDEYIGKAWVNVIIPPICPKCGGDTVVVVTKTGGLEVLAKNKGKPIYHYTLSCKAKDCVQVFPEEGTVDRALNSGFKLLCNDLGILFPFMGVTYYKSSLT